MTDTEKLLVLGALYGAIGIYCLKVGWWLMDSRFTGTFERFRHGGGSFRVPTLKWGWRGISPLEALGNLLGLLYTAIGLASLTFAFKVACL